jgi:hypothetical protein
MPAHSASEDARERAYVAGIYVSCAARAYAVLFPILLRRIRAFTPVFDGLWTRVNAL